MFMFIEDKMPVRNRIKSMKRILANNWPVILLCICGLVVIIGVRHLYNQSLTKPQPHHQTTSLVPLSQFIASVESVLKDSPDIQNTGSADAVNTIGAPVAGFSFNVIIPFKTLTALSYADIQTTSGNGAYASYQKILPKLNALFSHDGFDNLSSNSTAPLTGIETIEYFRRTDAECQITAYNLLDVYCDSLSDLEHIAALSEPLVEAYEAVYPTSDSLTVTNPSVLPSQTADYTVASLQLFGENGETKLNFYKQGSGNWQVVNIGWYNDPHEDASITPNCEDFDSLIATRQAFMGTICYDSGSRTTAVVGK